MSSKLRFSIDSLVGVKEPGASDHLKPNNLKVKSGEEEQPSTSQNLDKQGKESSAAPVKSPSLKQSAFSTPTAVSTSGPGRFFFPTTTSNFLTAPGFWKESFAAAGLLGSNAAGVQPLFLPTPHVSAVGLDLSTGAAATAAANKVLSESMHTSARLLPSGLSQTQWHNTFMEQLYKQSGLIQTPFFPGSSDPLSSHQFLMHPFRKPKRIRTAFSPTQLLNLEQAFETNHYVVGAERKQLAQTLGLTETQVKVWFQNRRTKHKRIKTDEDSHRSRGNSGDPSSQDGGSPNSKSSAGDEDDLDNRSLSEDEEESPLCD